LLTLDSTGQDSEVGDKPVSEELSRCLAIARTICAQLTRARNLYRELTISLRDMTIDVWMWCEDAAAAGID
jgi:hypothetical protein